MLRRRLPFVTAVGCILLILVGIWRLGAGGFVVTGWSVLLVVTGRSAGCSLPGAVQAGRTWSRQYELMSSARGASRLQRKDPGGFELWETPDGDYWIPKGVDLFYVLAEQQRAVYGQADHGVRRGDVVIDCGANVGVYTRHALKQGAATVVAVEPDPANVEALRRTFRTEVAEGRVIVYPKGVWDTTGVLRMWTYENSVLDSFVLSERPESSKAGTARDLPVTTIDALVAELKLERVHFIKMDIEGAEVRAIAGARSTLSRHRPRLAIATENLPDDYDAIPRAVRAVYADHGRLAWGACAVMWDGIIRPEVVFVEH